ncbi:MAG: rod shape-determining protein [Bdellovibrionota bacterium]
MFEYLFSSSSGIAIDLGTRNIRISNQKQILCKQLSVVARSNGQNSELIMGEIAEDLFEREPGHYKLISPLGEGVISDFDHCKLLLKDAFKALNLARFKKHTILISSPLDITTVEYNAFIEVAHSLGYGEAAHIHEPVAAAVGLIPNFIKEKGVILVDVGAGITEAVIFSLGGIVANTSLRIGGVDFEKQMISFIKKSFDFEIGRKTALRLLDIVAQEHPDSYMQPIVIHGTDLIRRLPSTLSVELPQIETCLDKLFNRIIESVLNVLEKSSPDLSSYHVDNGIYLTGGASQFKRLLRMLEKRTGLMANPDSQPLLGVARGEIALLQDAKLKCSIVNLYKK